MRILICSLLLAASMFASGCSKALLFNNGLFSHTVEPLSINREPTNMGENTEVLGRIHQFQYPLSSAVSVRIGKNGLGEVAREHGITTIYFADLERWSALFGLWSSEIVHVYGK